MSSENNIISQQQQVFETDKERASRASIFSFVTENVEEPRTHFSFENSNLVIIKSVKISKCKLCHDFVNKLASVEEEQKRKLDDAEQSVSKQSSRKKKIWNICFFIINVAVVAGILVYQLLKEDFVPINGMKVWPFFVLLLFFLLGTFTETIAMGYLSHKSTGKWNLSVSYKTYALGRYYDSVTPLATGGQAFQVTYLRGRDMPLQSALSIPFARYTFSQIVWVTVSLICLIVGLASKTVNTAVLGIAGVGFVLGSFMLFVTIFLSVCKTAGKKILVKVLKLLQKIKIVKNYEKQYEKISKYIEEFQSVMQRYIKSPKDFLILFGLYFLKLFTTYIMPYFIFRLFNPGEPALVMQFFMMGVLIDMASSFFPLPGGTGMNELSFSAMFASHFGGNSGALIWALLIWRFFTYYIFLLQGLVVLVYDFSYGNNKFRWQKRRFQLAEESRIFKQEQIDKFRAERARRRKRQKSNA